MGAIIIAMVALFVFLEEFFSSFEIFFVTLRSILDFAINSARNSSPDLFPNQRGL